MAVISIKNLVAPVTNMVHLVSIVFVVLLFAALRLSGGDLRATRGGSLRSPLSNSVDFERRAQDNSASKPAGSMPARGVISVPDEAADDLFDSMLGKGEEKPQRLAPSESRPRPRNDNSNSGSLEEIEKSLGIR